MKSHEKELTKQFIGYFNTPLLWDNTVMNLTQFNTNIALPPKFNIPTNTESRLGKRIERFFNFELSLDESISILLENYQVQDDKITLGEVDFLIEKNGIPIHIEVVYKFYVIDTSIGTNEIEHCVAPNKKDSLIKKITKLKTKQLPLIYNSKIETKLNDLNVDSSEIEQYVFFKAQLFLPINSPNFEFKFLNKKCVSGYYFHYTDLENFNTCMFYIPKKENWIQVPYLEVKWMCYSNFKENIKKQLEKQITPLVWIKFIDGKLQKCFII